MTSSPGPFEGIPRQAPAPSAETFPGRIDRVSAPLPSAANGARHARFAAMTREAKRARGARFASRRFGA